MFRKLVDDNYIQINLTIVGVNKSFVSARSLISSLQQQIFMKCEIKLLLSSFFISSENFSLNLYESVGWIAAQSCIYRVVVSVFVQLTSFEYLYIYFIALNDTNQPPNCRAEQANDGGEGRG